MAAGSRGQLTLPGSLQLEACSSSRVLAPPTPDPLQECRAAASSSPSRHSSRCWCRSSGTAPAGHHWRPGRSRHLHSAACPAVSQRPRQAVPVRSYTPQCWLPCSGHGAHIRAMLAGTAPILRTIWHQVAWQGAATHAGGGIEPRQVCVVAGGRGAAVVELRAPAVGSGRGATAGDGANRLHLQGRTSADSMAALGQPARVSAASVAAVSSQVYSHPTSCSGLGGTCLHNGQRTGEGGMRRYKHCPKRCPRIARMVETPATQIRNQTTVLKPMWCCCNIH